jgi:D-amino-acid dehydrogenase
MHDVIVVGGGVVGATTAYLCAREGLRTLLLDRADAGRATDAGAGILSADTSSRAHPVWLAFARLAVGYYPILLKHLEDDGGGETGYAVCDHLLVAASEDELEPFAALAARLADRREQYGWPAREDLYEISPQRAREMFPPLGRMLRALFHRNAARVDGRLLNQALVRAAERRGLDVRRANAERLLIDDGTVAGVVAGSESLRASNVVIAGGAWSKAFGAQLNTEIPVEPQRGQILHLQVAQQHTGAWPIVQGFHDHYLVSWDGGRVIAGATRETGSGFDPRLTAGGVQEVLAEALRVAPGLAGATMLEMRVGLRPLAADGIPVLGTVPGIEGIYLATGHGPAGLTLGPYSGKVICDLLLGRPVEANLAPFHVTRFL